MTWLYSCGMIFFPRAHTHTRTHILTSIVPDVLIKYHCLCFVAHYYGKKRKVGRPSLGVCTQDGDMAKPTRRRKKRKAVFVQKKRRSTVTGYHAMESAQVTHPYTHIVLCSPLYHGLFINPIHGFNS